ncbi:MAG: hypothetical protein AB1772_02415 [Candidatus Zixiibacteriota bacterium]
MKYLDYSKLAGFIAKHYAGSVDERRVGRLRQYESDYVDIVRFFGPDGVRPSDVRLNFLAESFRIVDPTIREFAQRIAFQMRAEGRIYSGPAVMKLASADLASGTPHLVVQPCDFGLQAGTCLALDLPDRRFQSVGGTLRDYYRRGCIVPTIDNNPLAICIGVCAMMIIDERGDRFLHRVERSSRLASLQNTLGPSVAGMVDFTTRSQNLSDLIETAVSMEVAEELHLHRDEYEVVPLAWAIELFRGERPQIFCLIRTLLDRENIGARLDAIPSNEREFASYAFVPLYGGSLLDRKDIDALNFEARMNYYLAEEHLNL